MSTLQEIQKKFNLKTDNDVIQFLCKMEKKDLLRICEYYKFPKSHKGKQNKAGVLASIMNKIFKLDNSRFTF